MGILNYSTTITAGKSAGEVVAILAKHGASTVASFYEAGEPSGIGFAIATEFGLRDFRLPANSAGVEAAMRADRTIPGRYKTRAQAQRVAWRILKDWVAAQLAIIEAGMSRLDEVMLPYMVGPTGETAAQIYRRQGALAIEAPQAPHYPANERTA